MNRRELALGIALSAIMASRAAAQNLSPPAARAADDAFYASFNEQLGAQPAALQPDIRRFYETVGWRPAWTPERIEALGRAVAQADRHGLAATDYLDSVSLVADPARADMRLTAAALGYAQVLSEGRVRPEQVEDLWEMQRNRAELGQAMAQALAAGRLAGWLNGLAPTDIGYTNLSAGYIRYRDLALRGGWPAFRGGRTVRPGERDGRIPALVRRLVAEGDLDELEAGAYADDLYAEGLAEALRRFQVRHGLTADGVIGEGTQSALSASAEDRARQIALNLERRRWLARELGPERIEVNTAAAIMVYWKDGRPVHSNRVVVGTARNQTPSLEKPFASVVANPPWYVPTSIARSEILPRGPGYLAANNMYVVDGRVIQRASPSSALGLVKFELQDSHAIFLHDTPAKALFQNAYRHRSHGCVRVEEAVEFARLLLAPDPERLARFDAALASRRTTRVETGRSISVRLLYWTAFVTGQGAVAFREDVYNRDRRLAEALGIAISLPRPVDDSRDDPADVGP